MSRCNTGKYNDNIFFAVGPRICSKTPQVLSLNQNHQALPPTILPKAKIPNRHPRAASAASVYFLNHLNLENLKKLFCFLFDVDALEIWTLVRFSFGIVLFQSTYFSVDATCFS